jgi:hypothetical protein
MASLLMMVMLILEEQLLSYQIYAECYCRNAEAGEGALEAIPSCERAGVSPGFARETLESIRMDGAESRYYRAHGSPWALLDAAANFFGSKPVIEGRSAKRMLFIVRNGLLLLLQLPCKFYLPCRPHCENGEGIWCVLSLSVREAMHVVRCSGAVLAESFRQVPTS